MERDEPLSEDPPPRKPRVGVVVAVILLILALVAGGGFLLGTYIVNPNAQSGPADPVSTGPTASSLTSPARSAG